MHKNATTTPAVRAAIQQSSASVDALAGLYGVSRQTIRRWRKRHSVLDASHTPHRLQTTLNAAQEELVIDLRTQLRLSLDDLLAVVRAFIEPGMSRSALDCLLRRRGHSRLPAPQVPSRLPKPFKADEPGDVHLDVKSLPQMADETARRDVCVAIDQATRWVFIRHQEPQDGGSGQSLPQRAAQGRAVPDPLPACRQRSCVHSRPFRLQSQGRLGAACARCPV
jgi:transposase-like protein